MADVSSPEGITREIARRLRDIRRAAGWTQGQVAERVGIDPATLSRYESGRFMPPIEVGHAICQVLGFPFEQLIAMSQAEASAFLKTPPVTSRIEGSAEQTELLNTWMRLRPRDRRIVIEVCYGIASLYADTKGSLWREVRARLFCGFTVSDAELRAAAEEFRQGAMAAIAGAEETPAPEVTKPARRNRKPPGRPHRKK